jgi:hypothetical protein
MNVQRKGYRFRPDPLAERKDVMDSIFKACVSTARHKSDPDRYALPKLDNIGEVITRAPTSPTKISDASALTQIRLSFLPSLIPVSAAAAVINESFQFSFDNAGSIVCPSVSLPTAGWVAEAQAISVLAGTTGSVTLSPFKLACILVLSREIVEAGDADAIMEKVLLENVGAALDAVFLTNAAASAGLSPAGILNGAISVTPAAAGSTAIVTDVSKLLAAVAPVAGNAAVHLVASPAQAAAIRTSLIDPPPTYASNALAAGTVAAIVPAAIASASSAPAISISKESTLHRASPASDLVASPSTVAAPQQSIWQTDSFALRYTQDLSWIKRGAGVAVATSVNWP